jgi:hypothetical protein
MTLFLAPEAETLVSDRKNDEGTDVKGFKIPFALIITLEVFFWLVSPYPSVHAFALLPCINQSGGANK